MTKNFDKITKKVANMYKKYPYPSPSTEVNQTNELLNLLRIFELESNIQLKNKKFLDAGSGSGHRIVNVAQHYKNCNFLGIDISDTSLKISQTIKANLIRLQHIGGICWAPAVHHQYQLPILGHHSFFKEGIMAAILSLYWAKEPSEH